MGLYRIAQFSLFVALTFSCKTSSNNKGDVFSNPQASPNSFVKIANGQLVLDGKPFNFVGSNYYRLALSDAFSSSMQKVQVDGKTHYPQIDQVLENYAKANIRVIRLWGFSCEASRGVELYPPIIYRDFSYSESALQQLDYTIAVAGRNGLKIILPFVNFEPEYCGWEWWVEHAFSKASSEDKERLTYSCTDVETHHVSKIVKDPKDCQGIGDPYVTRELFLTDPVVKNAYKNHLQTMLNRFNPYSGKAYKDDPAIMAIEVSNEPHTTDHYECMVTDVGRKTLEECKDEQKNYNAGKIVHDWLAEISTYIKSIDKSHLIASGEEGYRTSHSDPSCHERYQWIHDGSKGVDFAKNAAISSIDFMTTHLYPDNWGIATTDLPWFDRCVIQDRAKIARKHNKPIILEESGFNEQAYVGKPDAYASNRGVFIGRMFDYATNAGYQGVMIWQIDPLTIHNEVSEDDSFTFPIGTFSNDGQFIYTKEGDVVTRKAACINGPLEKCLVYGNTEGFPNCMKDTVIADGVGFIGDPIICHGYVNAKKQFNQTGRCECRIQEASQVVKVICPSGTKADGEWGWTKDQSVCEGLTRTKQQFTTSGGCSCKIDRDAQNDQSTVIESPHAICPAGTKIENGWGWTINKSVCEKSSQAKTQFSSSGGCSCIADGH